MKRALIIVDLQRDFCPAGALPAARADEIVPVINQLLRRFDLVIASKDWHPQKTVHFDKWPPHCVRATTGAAFHAGLHTEDIALIALKGTGNTDDGYSAFEATNMDVEAALHKRDIAEVYVAGLTTEYCVRATALDAFKFGFRVFVITDAVAAVEQAPGDHKKALQRMQQAGIIPIRSAEIQ